MVILSTALLVYMLIVGGVVVVDEVEEPKDEVPITIIREPK